jgi:1-acyl-sn-glycerol-3-phosphate acyltransferase
MGEFHGGSFRCAVKAKCPVVPMALVDSFKVLDQKGKGRLRVQIHYLPAILPEEFESLKAAQLADMVKNRIRDCMKENI